jgi:hypothetical protein
MSETLQVVVDEEELEAYRQVAHRRHLTLAEWVRQSLREARQAQPGRSSRGKLDSLRTATRHSYPTADIQQMLLQIEGGYHTTGG